MITLLCILIFEGMSSDQGFSDGHGVYLQSMKKGHYVLKSAFAGRLGHFSFTEATDITANFYLLRTMSIMPGTFI